MCGVQGFINGKLVDVSAAIAGKAAGDTFESLVGLVTTGVDAASLNAHVRVARGARTCSWFRTWRDGRRLTCR